MNAQDDALNRPPPLPLLFRNATPRTPGQDIPGQYDRNLSVWAVGERNGQIPIIEASDADLLEIVTKTAVQQESDDDAVSCLETPRNRHGLLEIETKTKVGGESDDEFPLSSALNELQAKTFIQQESDDDIDTGSLRILLELETKTEAQVEHDDESCPLL
jgi:hypothetical protein